MRGFKSPLNWYGGKYYMAADIIRLFPRHKVYCEVFGGAGHILFKKNRSLIEVYNDKHECLYLFFSMLRDEVKRNILIPKIQLTPYSRQEFNACRDWASEPDPIEKVRKFYVMTMQSISTNGGWAYARTVSRRGMSGIVSKWLGNADENLIDAIERLREVQIENLDCIECIEKYDSEDTLFYLDPPYVMDSRSAPGSGYTHEMTDDDHRKLIACILKLKGKVLLSGYDNDIYKELEGKGWERVKLGEFKKFSDIDREVATEYIWRNFKEKGII
jgi:DNA adenine methylase